MNNPQQGKQIKIDIVNQRPSDQPYGDLMMPTLQDVTPGAGCKTQARASTWCHHRLRFPAEHRAPRLNRIRRSGSPFGHRPFDPPANVPPVEVPSASPCETRSTAHSESAAAGWHGRAAGHGPEHPRHEHDRRQPGPERSVSEPVVRRHRHVDRRGPDRSIHDRRRGQQLSGLDRQLADLREELRHHQFSSLIQRHRQRPGVSRGRPVAE